MANLAALISSYKEGKLIQGAIRTANAADALVFVAEGCTEKFGVRGDKTDIADAGPVVFWNGRWQSEAEKRTEMLNTARAEIDGEFWVLTLDADEVLIWPEHLHAWLDALTPGVHSQENLVPIIRTNPVYWDADKGFPCEIASSRLVHSSVITRYLVGCYIFESPAGMWSDEFGCKIAKVDHMDSERMPYMGEPHIHHRYYLRRHERAGMRLSEGEEKRYIDKGEKPSG